MTTHDIIVAAMEAKRKELGMRKGQFAEVCLGMPGAHYSNLKRGDRKFTAQILRTLYGIGIPAEVLLGPTRPSPDSRQSRGG